MASFKLVFLCFLVLHLSLAVAEDEEELKVPIDQVKYVSPVVPKGSYLAETFDAGLDRRWVKSEAKKEDTDEDIAKYNGEWSVKEPENAAVLGDMGLVLTTKARHAAISAKLDRVFSFTDKPFVVQYEVLFQNGMECGGAYMKLLSDSPSLNLKQVTDKSGYTIMFGPDTCGVDKKLHFIMRHKNPKNGKYEEKHAKKPSGSLDFFSDKKTHLFRLTVRPDNQWEIHVDEALVNSGSLLEDMTPPINPPAEIDDPDDFKPSDWDDREKIPDPDATKPIDWDEDAPEFIPDEEAVKPDGWLDDEADLVADPEAKKPDDWDEDMDGEWEAPKIDNPKCAAAPGCGEWKRPKKKNPDYRGKWKPEMIDNPDYSGVWAPRRIPNPDFFEDKQPFTMTPIGAVSFELWTMTEGVLFDNIFISDDEKAADKWTAATWHVTRDAELAAAARNQPSWKEWLWELSNDKPWIWAIVVLGLLIPLAIVCYCCTSSSTPAEDSKKTDAPTQDDKPVEEEKEQAKVGAAGDADSSKPVSKQGRAKLNEPVSDEDDEEEAATSGDEPAGADKTDSGTEGGRRSSPRKRKPRKE